MTIRELTITGYRCFREFHMAGLGQVNLIVGRNSSGKTALLEALDLVLSAAVRPDRLWSPLLRRGETFPEEDRPRQRIECDVSHLVHGHRVELGDWFAIGAREADERRLVKVGMRPIDYASAELFPMSDADEQAYHGMPVTLYVETLDRPQPFMVPLTPRLGIQPLALSPAGLRRGAEDEGEPVSLITTESLSAHTASQYWKSIALTEEEHLVVEALRVLDSRIQRVAVIGPPSFSGPETRGGVIVRYEGAEQPVPIGSLGDGMWRMFSIAIALIRARGGTLLIDEIDTGLHYSVMEGMWSMVLETAERLGVQVFATTHSSDCINSLATLCREAPPGKISMQRLEPNGRRAIQYSEGEIWAAAQHGIETR